MTDSIIRDVDIVANTQSIQIAPAVTEAAVSSNGTTITAISSATTTGAGLPTAITNAGTNSFVVLQGTFNTTSIISMPGGQTIMGSGTVNVTTASGRTVTTSLPGATIAGTNVASAALQLNSNATVSGLTVSNAYSGGGGGSAVIMAGGAGNLTITNNTFTVTQSGTNGGVALNSGGGGANTNVVISGNMLTATGSGTATTMTALGLNGGGSTYSIFNNTIGASGGTTNRIVNLSSATINSGSSGNVNGGGVCNGTVTSGSILFTNGTSCP